MGYYKYIGDPSLPKKCVNNNRHSGVDVCRSGQCPGYIPTAKECERQMYRKSGAHVEFEKPVIPQRMFESYFSLPRR